MKRKKTERTTVTACEQRRANIHCTEMHFSEKKKKKRNVVTRNTGSDTKGVKPRKRQRKILEEEALCVLRTLDKVQHKAKYVWGRTEARGEAAPKSVCNRKYMEPCWALLQLFLCGLASPVTASDYMRHVQKIRILGKEAMFKRLMLLYLLTDSLILTLVPSFALHTKNSQGSHGYFQFIVQRRFWKFFSEQCRR